MPFKPIVRKGQAPTTTPPPADEGGSMVPAVLGGAALAGGAYALKQNPAAVKSALSRLGEIINATRMTSMLSGMAAPKSVLGNVGGVINASAERRSLEPLKQFFSRQTARDFMSELRNPTDELTLNPEQLGSVNKIVNPIGRFMGAADTATRRSLGRAGLSEKEAAREVLQSPLPPQIAESLNSPIMRWVLPFRRTPINQALEGAKTLKMEHPALVAAHAAGGFATGAASKDEKYPVLPGVYSAFAGRYGVPAIGGAVLGRLAAGGKGDAGLAGSVLPVSEYGVTQSLTEPLAPFDPEEVAAVRALRRITGDR